MKNEFTSEETQTILRAVRYWQYQVPVTHPDYQNCYNILHHWNNNDNVQNQEQSQ